MVNVSSIIFAKSLLDTNLRMLQDSDLIYSMGINGIIIH